MSLTSEQIQLNWKTLLDKVKKTFSANSEQAFAHKFIREYEKII